MVPTQATAVAQQMPVDPQITMGKFANGLRYYSRNNKKPEKRAELRLVVNAGSILEDDDQQGLAHMVEHMAFNGTLHFPKQDLISFIESLGMRFGADLNAYTSFDETVYILQVPTDKPEAIDLALLIRRTGRTTPLTPLKSKRTWRCRKDGAAAGRRRAHTGNCRYLQRVALR